jgi:hypothetical protein
LIGWTRSRSTARATWAARSGPLENWLTANYALRTLSRTTLALHGPCSWRSLHRSPLWGAGRCGAGWRSCVHRTRPCLRRNHSSLLHNRLARYRLGRRRRSRSSLRTYSHWRRCWRLLRCYRRWRNHDCWRMSGRRDHYCGRSRGLFWRRRNYYCRCGRLYYGRCNHSTSFRCRSSRFGHYNGWFFCRWRSYRWGRRFYGDRRSSGWSGHGGRFGRRRGRMLLLLLSFSEQPCYVTRLGDLGEVNLWFDLCRGRSFTRRRAGPGRKMLSYPYRFIFLNRA